MIAKYIFCNKTCLYHYALIFQFYSQFEGATLSMMTRQLQTAVSQFRPFILLIISSYLLPDLDISMQRTVHLCVLDPGQKGLKSH